jgi:hypothetical protein
MDACGRESVMLVQRMVGCGNSPKNAFLEDFCVKVFENEPVVDAMADDVTIYLAYDRLELGKAQVGKASLAGKSELKEVTINQVVSHGRGGSVDATAIDVDGLRIDYCFTFTFASLKADTVKLLKVYRH